MTTKTARTTTKAPALNILDQATELQLIPTVIPGTVADTLNVATKLVITGTEDQGHHGWAELTIRCEDFPGTAEFGVDARQARDLAQYLAALADELDTRTA